nr:integrase, catalytic region, zinc finger, CCHC-type, peptidase aspartic, catalytic [Tanacetum cinerariifolium]
MYDDYIGGQSSATARTVLAAQEHQHDEEQTVIRNKSRLVIKGYRQEEGIDFEESFAPNHFFKGTIDPTLFIRLFHDEILVMLIMRDVKTPSRVLSVELNSKVKSWLAGPQRNKSVQHCQLRKQNMCLYPLAVPNHSHILQPVSTLKNKTHRFPLPVHKGAYRKGYD